MSGPRPERKPRAVAASERVRQPTEIRRALIVEAARGVIAERGLFATTMRDIARASRVSLGTVTYHFSGIADILGEVLQKEMDALYLPITERARAAPDATSAMHALVDGFFSADQRMVEHWRLWLDFWALSAHDELHARWQAKTYELWRNDVRQIFERGTATGEFAAGDLDAAMIEFMAIFDGLAAHAYLPGWTMGPEQAREHLRGWVSRRLIGQARSPQEQAIADQ